MFLSIPLSFKSAVRSPERANPFVSEKGATDASMSAVFVFGIETTILISGNVLKFVTSPFNDAAIFWAFISALFICILFASRSTMTPYLSPAVIFLMCFLEGFFIVISSSFRSMLPSETSFASSVLFIPVSMSTEPFMSGSSFL